MRHDALAAISWGQLAFFLSASAGSPMLLELIRI
jgi:hypothetical protein